MGKWGVGDGQYDSVDILDRKRFEAREERSNGGKGRSIYYWGLGSFDLSATSTVRLCSGQAWVDVASDSSIFTRTMCLSLSARDFCILKC